MGGPYRAAQKQDYVNVDPLSWHMEDYNLLQGLREDFEGLRRQPELIRAMVELDGSGG